MLLRMFKMLSLAKTIFRIVSAECISINDNNNEPFEMLLTFDISSEKMGRNVYSWNTKGVKIHIDFSSNFYFYFQLKYSGIKIDCYRPDECCSPTVISAKT